MADPIIPGLTATDSGNRFISNPDANTVADQQNMEQNYYPAPVNPQTPQQTSAELTPQPRRSPLKSMLMNMATFLGTGIESQAAVLQHRQATADIALAQAPYAGQEAKGQADTATANAQRIQLENELAKRRVQAMATMAAGQDPFTGLGEMSQDEKALAGIARQEASMNGDPTPIFNAIKQITSQRAIFGRQTRGDTTVTPELAQQYPALVPFIGKPINAAQMGAIARGEAINNVFSNTAAGPIVTPKSGPNAGVAKPVTLNGKSIPSTQEAGAYWQAKYGVVQGQDENGPVFMSRLNAPGQPTANSAFQMFKGKAGLDNFKDALGRITTNLDVMKDTTQRALVAQTLRNIGTQHDPGIIASYIGNAVSSGLTPQAADLVAATLNAREWIGANRSFAGNFQGSEALYQRMVANIAGPMNSPEVNRALIKQDIDNTNKVEDRILKYQAPRQQTSGGTPIVQHSPSTGQYRYSTDGGKTWQAGKPNQ